MIDEEDRWFGSVDGKKVATEALINDIKYRIETFTAPSFDAETMQMVINWVDLLETEQEEKSDDN